MSTDGRPIEYTYLKDIKPGMKFINVTFIVLEIGKPNRLKDGHNVRSVKVADRTGSMSLSVWDQVGDALQTGDICKLHKGYAAVFKNCLTLYTGKNGEIWKCGEFCFLFSEAPNFSEPNQELYPAFNKDGPNAAVPLRKEPGDGAEAVHGPHRGGQPPVQGNGNSFQRVATPQNRGPPTQPQQLPMPPLQQNRSGPPLPRPRR